MDEMQLDSNKLKLEFVQNISHANVEHCSRRIQAKLLDHLHDKGVECRKSTNYSIDVKLLELLHPTRDQVYQQRK